MSMDGKALARWIRANELQKAIDLFRASELGAEYQEWNHLGDTEARTFAFRAIHEHRINHREVRRGDLVTFGFEGNVVSIERSTK